MVRASLALAALLLVATHLPAADPPPAAPAAPDVTLDNHLATARDALLVAREQLRLAETGKADSTKPDAPRPDAYGDSRRLALELVNTALVEVDAGLLLVRREAERKAKEAQEKTRASKRKRR